MFLKGRKEILEENVRRCQTIQGDEERRLRQQEIMVMTLQAGEDKRLIEKEREQLTGNDIYDNKIIR
jgi:hypothetical protein